MSNSKELSCKSLQVYVQQWLVMMTHMLDCLEQTLALLEVLKNELDFEKKDILGFEKLRSKLDKMRRQMSSLGHSFLDISKVKSGISVQKNAKNDMEQFRNESETYYDKRKSQNVEMPTRIDACNCNTFKTDRMVACSRLDKNFLVNQKCMKKGHGAVENNDLKPEDYPDDDSHPDIIKDTRGLNLPGNGYGYELFYAMHRHKDKVAQIIEITDETQTFDDLLSMSVKTAVKLTEKGLKQGDLMCVCVSNSNYSSIPYLAGLFLGCTMSAIDISFNLEDVCFFIELATPTIMFVDEGKVAVIQEALQKLEISMIIVVVGEKVEGLDNIQEYIFSSIDNVSQFRPYKVKSMKENCAIFFSSGTSGYPKAICLSHCNLLYQITYTAIHGNLNDVVLSYTSFYWISGVILLGYCILTGSPRILPLPFDVSRFYALVDKHKVQIAFLGPFECTRLVKSSKPSGLETSSLRWIIAGGAVLKEEFVFSLRRIFEPCRVMQSYGQTETTGPIFKWDVTLPEDLALCVANPASTGKSFGGVWYKIIDENTGRILGPNLPGEICIKSDTLLMNGYYKKDPAKCFDQNGWLRTGDLGYYDEYHCFYIVDRIKELIKFRGWHVPPVILENLLLKHPVVANAVVVGFPHPEDGEHPTGLIILKEGIDPESVNLQKVAEFVNLQVDETKCLRGGVKIISSLPLTATGKVNRRALRDTLVHRDI